MHLDNEEFFFYTCGRPGRSNGADGNVSDAVVNEWAARLNGDRIGIISLLGWKNAVSEFSFYSFRGAHDENERPNALTFHEWLENHVPATDFVVREFPTHDFQRIPDPVLAAIAAAMADIMLLHDRSLYLVDSGGMQRTRFVAEHLGASQDFRR